jgi:transcriptional regulator with XRE-family HTH domain
MRPRLNITGRMIAWHRYQRGWTQTDLATEIQLLNCHMTRQLLAHIEHGRSMLSDIQLPYVARALAVSVVDLFPIELRQSPPSLESLSKHCISPQERKPRRKKALRSK